MARQPLTATPTVEGYAARLCAEAALPDLPAALHAALDLQLLSIRNEGKTGYAEADQRVHELIALHCGNPELRSMIDRLHARMRISLVRVAELPAHRRLGHDELREVAQAIEHHDPDAAEAAMRRHIGRTRSAISELAGDA